VSIEYVRGVKVEATRNKEGRKDEERKEGARGQR
jgi:hypothetical protein